MLPLAHLPKCFIQLGIIRIVAERNYSMPQPIITVLVPIYNTEQYLSECLDALAAQTLDEIKFILIDDGSTDSSPNIIDNCIKSDKRFSVIRKANSGYGAR